MSLNIRIGFLLIYTMLVICACNTYDLDPDKISNEIRIGCSLVDSAQINLVDTTLASDIWVNSYISNGCDDRQFDYLGLCWNYNTDTMPTIKSEKHEMSWHDIDKYIWRTTSDGIILYYFMPVITGIPLTDADVKIICRGYIIFNDTLVRYSEPLILNDLSGYAD